MSEQISRNYNSFRVCFLLKFTKELIRNTETYKKTLISESVKSLTIRQQATQNKQTRPIEIQTLSKINQPQLVVKRKVLTNQLKNSQARMMPSIMKGGEALQAQQESNPFKSFSTRKMGNQNSVQNMPQIPETSLPPTVQYLRPVPTPLEIDLKKINPLIKDPLVKTIECNGPGESVFVTGNMGRKKTAIVLTKEEIDEVIKKFSDSARIPLSEGIFKVVFGRLVLTSIVSEIIGSKFIIKKMSSSPQMQGIPLPVRY